MPQKTQGRQKNLDELRCLAMMMVVVLHFLGKGELLGDVTAPDMSTVGIGAWVLEAFSIVAVNCYMLISGYFLSESDFKLSRLLRLYLQIWIYSVGIGLLSVICGIVPAEEVNTHYYLSLIFPVSMGHYWFMTAYVFLYLLFPLVGMAVRKMDKTQFRLVLAMLFAVFCALKSLVPVRLEQDAQGYDMIWYLCMFLAAAYIRKYGVGFLDKKWKCLLLYLAGVALILTELFVLHAVYVTSGKFELILKVSFEYNHIFVLIASLGLFGLFLNSEGKGPAGTIASKLAPYVLGAYLLHENIGVRYTWQELFGAKSISTVPELVGKTFLAAVCVFAAGTALERIRSMIGRCLKFGGALERWDMVFRKEQSGR